MRVEKIAVTKLFGIFDHVIPLNLDDRITIIHGPNGFGKTKLLQMMDGVLNQRYSIFTRIPFEKFRVDFDDGSWIAIEPNFQDQTLPLFPTDKERGRPSLSISISITGADKKTFTLGVRFISRTVRSALRTIERHIPEIHQIDVDTWRLGTSETLTLTEVLERFGDVLPSDFYTFVDDTKLELDRLMEEFVGPINVHLIDTQRLVTLNQTRGPKRYDDTPRTVPSVVKYSEELAEIIQKLLADSAILSQSLDRTFPSRLVKESQPPQSAKREFTKRYDALRKNLSDLEAKRSRLVAAGLLDKQEDTAFQIPEPDQIDDSEKNFLATVLSVYVHDIEQKLSVFDELANKIDLLSRIIHKRFLYKHMSISKDNGFMFQTSNKNPLSPDALSSGEQHELVLLYELLFKVEPNSLILIDEPEISLHIEWQQEFLKDLLDITKSGGFDVLIATHSPDIIFNREDLMVDLTGPTEEIIER